jgi:hypothetical protein
MANGGGYFMSIEQAGRYGRAFAKHGSAFAQRLVAREKLAMDGTDPDDDAGETLSSSIASQICDFAKDRMSAPDFADFVALLQSLSGVAEDETPCDETEEERQERLARCGRTSGGSYGLDAGRHSDRRLDTRKAEAEFKALFPNAGAVASGFDVASQDARLIHTAKAEAEFRKICPDAKPLIRV